MDTALSEVLVFKLLRTEIAADPDGAGWTLSFLHCTSGP
ncbi:phage tail protein, partial [Salmonella enterica]|nr:phage tail protein [Salmonella enterica]